VLGCAGDEPYETELDTGYFYVFGDKASSHYRLLLTCAYARLGPASVVKRRRGLEDAAGCCLLASNSCCQCAAVPALLRHAQQARQPSSYPLCLLLTCTCLEHVHHLNASTMAWHTSP